MADDFVRRVLCLSAANTTRFVILSLASNPLPDEYPVPTHRFVSAAPTPKAPLSPAGDSKRKVEGAAANPVGDEATGEPAAKAAKVDPDVVAASNGA